MAALTLMPPRISKNLPQAQGGISPALIALLVVYGVWGTTLAAMHIAIESIPPAIVVSSRYIIAGLLLMGFSFLKGERIISFQQIRRELMIGFFVLFAGNTFIYWALKALPTGIAGVLTALAPFYMVGLARILPPHDRVPPLAWVGLTIGFLGMMILFLPTVLHPNSVEPFVVISMVGMMVMNIFWAYGSVKAKYKPSAVSLLMGVGIQNFFAGSLALLCTLPLGEWKAFEPTTASLLGVFYLIFFGTIVAMPCYLYTLKHLPIAVAGTPTYVSPIITLAIGVMLFHEPLTMESIVAAIVILLGVVLVQWSRFQKPSVQRPGTQKVDSTSQSECPSHEGISMGLVAAKPTEF